MQFSLNEKVPRSTIHFERWARYLRHRHSIKVFKNKVDLNIVKFHLCSLQGSHAVPVEINLNSNQALVRFRLKRSLDLIDRKICKKQNNEHFFIQLLNTSLHFTKNNFPTSISIEEITDQPISLKPHTKLGFSSHNPYFYCISPRKISNKFTIITYLCRFLQPGVISSTTIDDKLSPPTVNHKRIYKLI